MRPIAFATYQGLPELSPGDQLAAAELLARGVTVEPAVWSDGAVDWGRFEAVIVRSCWDYTEHVDAFLAWAEGVAARTALWNPPELLRWNARKTYLRELAERGVDVVPTAWLPPGDPTSFVEVLDARGWHDVVLKPIVSASAFETWHVDRSRAGEGQAILDRLRRGSGALVQPFLPEITSAGEWSFVLLASGYSHAVCKRPKVGDFRVQFEFGGTVRRRHAPDALVVQAQRAADALARPWLFARVDGVEVGDRLLVMEVECIEPELFLAGDPALAGRFADAVVAALRAPAAFR